MRNHRGRLAIIVVLGVLTAVGVAVRVRAQNSAALLDRLKPDLLLVNGKIVTVDSNFSIAQAVAIKDGKIVGVGTNEDIKSLAGKNTKVEDLQGRTVLPGFIDPHVHYAHKVGKKEDPWEDKFAEAKSIADVVAAVKGKIEAEKPAPGTLVWMSRGVRNAAALAEKRWPTRLDLDPVSPNNPVLLGFASDHTTIVNTVLLKKVGITKDTPQPTEKGQAGEIVKDPKTGEPTGILIEKGATTLARGAFDMYPTDELEENIKRGFERVNSYGVTSLYDPMSNASRGLDNRPGMLAYQRLARKGEMKVRVNNMIRLPIRVAPLEDVMSFLNELLYINFTSDYLRVGTLKVSVDGSGYRVPKESIKTVLKAAHKAGWQLFIHLGGQESWDAVIESLDEAYKEFPRKDARHVITHARNPTPKNIAILKKWGIMVEPQPPAQLRTYLDNGIVVMTGTDQKPIGPLHTIWAAVTEMRDDGTVVEAKEKITLQEAIRACTITAAWGSFEENVKGSIEYGKFADLVVLGKDLMTVPAEQIKDIPVMMTMVGGKWVYINPNKDPNQKVKYISWG